MSKRDVKFECELVESKGQGGVDDLQVYLGSAQGNLEYANRKLWVRVDELERLGRDEAGVMGTLQRDMDAVKIPKFLNDGMKALDNAQSEANALERRVGGVVERSLRWRDEWRKVVLRGRAPAGGLKKWLIRQAKELDDIREDIYELQGQ